jgi:sensor c-di-GMP phosphodiesterase-like protein
MGKRVALFLTILAASIAFATPPWFAMREARRQAIEVETSMAFNHARDIQHRGDAMAAQALGAIERLRASGNPPCSEPGLALAREVDLESSYLQAIGRLDGTRMSCSSLGGPPVDLGHPSFQTSRGITIYGDVPLPAPYRHALLGLARGGYVALVHRDLPLDAASSGPDLSLALVHLEHDFLNLSRGHVDPAWIARLGAAQQASFIADGWLVAIVRSPNFVTTAAIAAVPAGRVEQRVADNLWSALPIGLFAGIAAACAVLLLARRQMSIPNALRTALQRGEFFLLYQPVIDLRSGHCTGAEALLRWRRQTGELVGPDLFIPVAEQSGLITRLTERVLDMVESEAGSHLALHPEFHISINLSPADLRSPALIGRIDAMLARSGARPSNLILEITERGFVDLDAAREKIRALHERGIEVAIDDFGTGYSSLAYLESLDLDYLKIDRSFIEAIGTGAPTSQVVGHIIAMARGMSLAMIAEGVESAAQAEFLRAHGVQYAQGWLFAKPMPFAEVAALHATHPGQQAALAAGAA